MTLGLVKKLSAAEIHQFKSTWEARCRDDLLALARDHINFYCTLYKNPPRIRELFSALTPEKRQIAATHLLKSVSEDAKRNSADKGFNWQMNPRCNDRTLLCIGSMESGELWPSWLTRVKGHPEDPDYPADLGPPHGMDAFHTFDLYCQILCRAL